MGAAHSRFCSPQVVEASVPVMAVSILDCSRPGLMSKRFSQLCQGHYGCRCVVMVAGAWFMNTTVLCSHNTLLLVVCADVQRLEDGRVGVLVGVRALLLALLHSCPKLFWR